MTEHSQLRVAGCRACTEKKDDSSSSFTAGSLTVRTEDRESGKAKYHRDGKEMMMKTQEPQEHSRHFIERRLKR